MENLLNVHPGEIIQTEYLDELSISAYRLSKSIKVQQSHISKLLKGEIGISADMAMRLGKFFGTSPSFWLNMQQYYDIRKVEI